MAGLILELQADALNSKVPVADLLRKAYVVSKKLNLQDFEKWISYELYGYESNDDLPSYRALHGEIKVFNPYHGYQPLNFDDPKIQENLSTSPCWQPVGELDSLIVNQGRLYVPFSQKITNTLMKHMDVRLQPTLEVHATQIIGILDAVRNTVLNWALTLEQQGILGEGLSFTSEEQKTASQTTYQITNHIGSMYNSQLQQHSTNSSQTINPSFDSTELLSFLNELLDAQNKLSLNSSDQKELQSEISTIKSQTESPKPKLAIVKESLKSIRAILEGAAGNLLSSDLASKAASILQQLI